MPIDPATLALTDWRRAPYVSPSWGPLASAGSSGIRGQLTDGSAPATVGPLLNGYAPAQFSGAEQLVEDTYALGSLISATAWSFAGLIKPAATAATFTAGAGYNDPAVITDPTNGYWYLSYTTSGFAIGHFDPTAGVWIEAVQAAAPDQWHRVYAWFDAVNIYISVDGAAPASSASTDQAVTGTGFTTYGRSFASTFFSGLIAETMFADTAILGTTERANVDAYFLDRYFGDAYFKPPPDPLIAGPVIDGPFGFFPPTPTFATDFPSLALLDFVSFPDLLSRAAPRQGDAIAQPLLPPSAPASTPFVPSVLGQLVQPSSPAHLRADGVEAPLRDRTAPIAGVTFPDAVARSTFAAATQDAVEGSLRPERSTPLAAVVHPDRIDRLTFTAAQQLAATEAPPKPERVAPLAAEVHPDRVDRLSFGAWLQLHVTELPPVLERSTAQASAVHPDRVDRATFGTQEQLHVTELPPKPERTSPAAASHHADRVDRVTFGAHLQLASSEVPTQPERSAPVASVAFPDKIARLELLVANQPFATGVLPKPERPAPIAAVVHPDAIARLATPAATQLAVSEIPPRPERTSVFAGVVHPDAMARVAFGAHEQLASVFARELLVVFVPFAPNDLAIAPATIASRVSHASSHVATVRSPQPLAAAPAAPSVDLTVFPDTTSRRDAPQAARTTAPVAPEQRLPVPLVAAPTALAKPTFPTSAHRAVVGDPRPERVVPIVAHVEPEHVRSQRQSTNLHLPFALPPQPERAVPIVSVAAPERVRSRQQPVATHLAFALPPQPEARVPHTSVLAPVAVGRRTYQAIDQATFVIAPAPPAAAVPSLVSTEWAATLLRALVAIQPSEAFGGPILSGGFVTVVIATPSVAVETTMLALALGDPAAAIAESTTSDAITLGGEPNAVVRGEEA